jgi:hypothetical protein
MAKSHQFSLSMLLTEVFWCGMVFAFARCFGHYATFSIAHIITELGFGLSVGAAIGTPFKRITQCAIGGVGVMAIGLFFQFLFLAR